MVKRDDVSNVLNYSYMFFTNKYIISNAKIMKLTIFYSYLLLEYHSAEILFMLQRCLYRKIVTTK